MRADDGNYPYLLVLPALVIFGVLYLLPTLLGFYFSLTDWNSFNIKIKFIGLQNFAHLLDDEVTGVAMKNTLIYSAGTAIFQNLLALGLAILLNQGKRLTNFFRSVFFFPTTLSPLIVAYVFMSIMYPTGIFNKALGFLLGRDVRIQWTGDPQYSMYTIVFVAVWFGSGLLMAIYLASLKNIPLETIEAARMDGASKVQVLLLVELPMIAPGFTINIAYSLISSLKVFAVVFLLTDGGPGRATEVMNTFVFHEFAKGRFGYATAIGVVSFLLVCVVAFPVLVAMKKREDRLQ